jgi:hypothetical protein
MNWKEKNNITSFSENVLLTYFEEFSNTLKPYSKIMYFCYIYRAIKLICNRAIHESEIVCRFLNKKHSLKHRLDLGI